MDNLFPLVHCDQVSLLEEVTCLRASAAERWLYTSSKPRLLRCSQARPARGARRRRLRKPDVGAKRALGELATPLDCSATAARHLRRRLRRACLRQYLRLVFT